MIPPLDNVIWHPWHGFYVRPREYIANAAVVACDIEDELAHGTIAVAEEVFVGLNSEEERFRSFAERYVIERAPAFRSGHEQEDAWAAMLDAKGIYTQIRGLGAASFGTPDTTAAPGQGSYHSGGGGQPTPNRKRGGIVPQVSGSQLERIMAAAQSPETPKRGSLAKLKAAARRLGGQPKI